MDSLVQGKKRTIAQCCGGPTDGGGGGGTARDKRSLRPDGMSEGKKRGGAKVFRHVGYHRIDNGASTGACDGGKTGKEVKRHPDQSLKKKYQGGKFPGSQGKTPFSVEGTRGRKRGTRNPTIRITWTARESALGGQISGKNR